LTEHVNWDDNRLDKVVFRKELKKAIESLEEHHRLTFVLRYIEELSINEIAGITDSRPGTVKSRLFYATKKVAKRLKEFNPSKEGMIFKIN